MRLSVNELDSLARKAAVGAGIDHGNAAETARALVFLAGAGINGVPALAQGLQAWTAAQTGAPRCRRDGSTYRLESSTGCPACSLHTAPALRDFARLAASSRSDGRVEARHVHQPGWIAGRIAADFWEAGITVRCIESAGAAVRWTLRTEDGTFVLSGNVDDPRPADLVVSVPGADNDVDRPKGPEKRLAADMQRLYDQGVCIEPADYAALRYYFDLTLVPDSEASRRHGAGAGLVDTD